MKNLKKLRQFPENLEIILFLETLRKPYYFPFLEF